MGFLYRQYFTLKLVGDTDSYLILKSFPKQIGSNANSLGRMREFIRELGRINPVFTVNA